MLTKDSTNKKNNISTLASFIVRISKRKTEYRNIKYLIYLYRKILEHNQHLLILPKHSIINHFMIYIPLG